MFGWYGDWAADVVGEVKGEEGHFCEQWLEGDGLMKRRL